MDPAIARRFNRRRLMQGSAGLLGIAAAGGGRGIGRALAQAEVSGEIEFSYYNWGPESIDFFKQMATAFEASHSGTKITLSLPPFEQYDQTLSVLLATGNGPDIITTAGATQALFQEGRLLDVTDLVAADPVLMDPDKFIQSGWDVYRFGTDRIYGMYSGADTLLLYYNKTMFDTAGIPYPSAEWTWDNFVEAAKALTIRDGDRVTQWGCVLGSFDDPEWGWANLVWMEGGDLFDSRPQFSRLTLNNEPVLKVLHLLNDLVYTHEVAPTPSISESVADQGGFESGTVGMVVDGGWSIQTFKAIEAFEWDIQTLPVGSQGFVGQFWPGAPMQISANSDNQELAWEYLRWFATDVEAQTIIAKLATQVPALLEVANSETFLGVPGLPGNVEAWTRSLLTALPGDSFNPKKAELIDKIWRPEWEKFQNDSVTAEEFAAKVETDGNEFLQES